MGVHVFLNTYVSILSPPQRYLVSYHSTITHMHSGSLLCSYALHRYALPTWLSPSEPCPPPYLVPVRSVHNLCQPFTRTPLPRLPPAPPNQAQTISILLHYRDIYIPTIYLSTISLQPTRTPATLQPMHIETIRCTECQSSTFRTLIMGQNMLRLECSTSGCLFFVDIYAHSTPQTYGPVLSVRPMSHITDM